jgi:hypothetical protein
LVECGVVGILGVELKHGVVGGCELTTGLPGVLIGGIAGPAD